MIGLCLALHLLVLLQQSSASLSSQSLLEMLSFETIFYIVKCQELGLIFIGMSLCVHKRLLIKRLINEILVVRPFLDKNKDTLLSLRQVVAQKFCTHYKGSHPHAQSERKNFVSLSLHKSMSLVHTLQSNSVMIHQHGCMCAMTL